MIEPAPGVDAATLQVGLLMESAQAHQKLAEVHLDRLRAHTRDIDGVVREEIRRTLTEELKSLVVETERATRALREMRRAASLRLVTWNLGLAVLCTALPAGIVHGLLPSPASLEALRAQRAVLEQSVARLEQRGGRVDWRSCGNAARLCVRIDRSAPVYGDKADYYVLKGY